VIPNNVSAAFMADVLCAVRARPLMAVAPDEMEEIVSGADALAVNLGQPVPEKFEACKKALQAAALTGTPAILDPVGAGASSYRLTMALALKEIPWKGIVKGNRAEQRALEENCLSHTGVDCIDNGAGVIDDPESTGNQKQLWRPVIKETGGRTLVLTGREDTVLSDRMELTLLHTGDLPYDLTGTGCAAGALCGAFLAVLKEPEFAAAAALSLLGLAMEKADGAAGYGSYRIRILDMLSETGPEELAAFMSRCLSYKAKEPEQE
jgi:hydroxyethylthiazole kinase